MNMNEHMCCFSQDDWIMKIIHLCFDSSGPPNRCTCCGHGRAGVHLFSGPPQGNHMLSALIPLTVHSGHMWLCVCNNSSVSSIRCWNMGVLVYRWRSWGWCWESLLMTTQCEWLMCLPCRSQEQYVVFKYSPKYQHVSLVRLRSCDATVWFCSLPQTNDVDPHRVWVWKQWILFSRPRCWTCWSRRAGEACTDQVFIFIPILRLTCADTVSSHQARDGGGVVPQSPWLWLLAVWRGHQHTAELRGPVRASRGSGGGSNPERERKGKE